MKFNYENWQEKSPKPLWFRTFLRRYLNRFALLVAEAGLEPTVLYFLCGENTAVGSVALTVNRTVIHYHLTLRVMRDFKAFLRSYTTVYRGLRTQDIQHIETNFENFLILHRITPEFITFFAKVLEKLLEKRNI